METARLALRVFSVALTVRIAFGLLIANTYDYDEFVLLLLSRDFAHGGVAYRDFMFFHPPGALLLLRAIEPLTSLWWPWARVTSSVVDAATAGLIAALGVKIFDRRTGLLAGVAYALSPLALVAGVRVGQDPLLTCLGAAALCCLAYWNTTRGGIAAGALLGFSVSIKYPALYFLPVCCLLAPRRTVAVIVSAVLAFGLVLLPFHDQLHAMYTQTVTFQRHRWDMPWAQRAETTALFWIGLNLAALPSLFRRVPLWLSTAFVLGGAFIFSSQTYYHYFVLVLPAACLLAGHTLAPLSTRTVGFGAAIAVALSLALGVALNVAGPSPLFVTAAKLSDVAPTVRLVDRFTKSGDAILADRFEYAYLADRPAADHYFWNIGVLVDAGYLVSRLPTTRAVILSTGASSGYPAGFERYLSSRYRSVHLPTTTVWLIPLGKSP